MPSQTPAVGLAMDELVLRGGFLKNPVILPACQVVGGALYFPLLKSDPVLSNFLSPMPCNRRPLRATRVPEELQKLRNAFILNRGEEAEPDFAEDLVWGGGGLQGAEAAAPQG